MEPFHDLTVCQTIIINYTTSLHNLFISCEERSNHAPSSLITRLILLVCLNVSEQCHCFIIHWLIIQVQVTIVPSHVCVHKLVHGNDILCIHPSNTSIYTCFSLNCIHRRISSIMLIWKNNICSWLQFIFDCEVLHHWRGRNLFNKIGVETGRCLYCFDSIMIVSYILYLYHALWIIC